MNHAFILNVVTAAGIRIIRNRQGRYLFTRHNGPSGGTSVPTYESVDVSRSYRSINEAAAAAHKHYRLRSH